MYKMSSLNRFLAFAAVVCFAVTCHALAEDDRQTEEAARHIPVFLSEPKKLFVDVGSMVTLDCKVDRLEPFVLMWKKGSSMLFMDTKKMSQNPRISMDESEPYRVTISNVDEEDEGDYICQISTPGDKKLELIHILTVKQPPQITAQPPAGDVKVSEGDVVTLICDADGRPEPKITWKTEEFDVKNGEIMNGGSTLVFRRVTETDAGQYECIASNGVGKEARVVYRLRVNHPPKITIEETLIPTADSPGLELICRVKAEPNSREMSWMRNDRPVATGGHVHLHSAGHTLRLKFSHLKESDFGNYTCAATNEMGADAKTVLVSGSPNKVTFKSQPKGMEAKAYTIDFGTQSIKPIIEYKLLIRDASTPKELDEAWQEVTIPGKEQSSFKYNERFELTGLTPATVYEVVMKARNSFGWSSLSEPFRFATLGGDIRESNQLVSSTDKSAEVKSGLQDKSNGSSKPPAYEQRVKTFALMTVVVLVAFF